MAELQSVRPLTKRCAICRKALVWDAENKWWVCPRCGYTMIAPPPNAE